MVVEIMPGKNSHIVSAHSDPSKDINVCIMTGIVTTTFPTPWSVPASHHQQLFFPRLPMGVELGKEWGEGA